jgi:hypothetical protein
MTRYCLESEKEDGDGGKNFWVKTKLALAGAPRRQTAVVVGGGDGVSFEGILKFWG